jgi:hypothetical protein
MFVADCVVRRCLTALLLSAGLFTSAQAADPDPAEAARDAAVVQAVLRLENFDLNSSEKAKSAILRYLAANRGSDEYFELVKRFQLREAVDDLLKLALEHPEDNQGVAAARLLLELQGAKAFAAVTNAEDAEQALPAIIVLGLVANGHSLRRCCNWSSTGSFRRISSSPRPMCC